MIGLVLAVVIAAALWPLLRWLRQPPVFAAVIAGLMLSPAMLDPIHPDLLPLLWPAPFSGVHAVLADVATAVFVAHVAAAVHLSTNVRAELKRVLWLAGGTLGLPMVLGLGVGWMLLALDSPVLSPSRTVAFLVIVSVACSMTAVPILAAIIGDCDFGGRPVARWSLLAAAAQDLAAWTLLSAAVLVYDGDADSDRLSQLLPSIGLLAVLAVAARKVLVTAAGRMPPLGLLLLTGLGLAVVVSAAHGAGVETVVAAFAYGLAVPRTVTLRVMSTPFAGRYATAASAILLPALFSWTSQALTAGGIGNEFWLLLPAVVVVAVGGKYGGVYVVRKRAQLSSYEAWVAGALLNTRGLTELVVASIAFNIGVFDREAFLAFTVMALLTTAATVPSISIFDRRRQRAARDVVIS